MIKKVNRSFLNALLAILAVVSFTGVDVNAQALQCHSLFPATRTNLKQLSKTATDQEYFSEFLKELDADPRSKEVVLQDTLIEDMEFKDSLFEDIILSIVGNKVKRQKSTADIFRTLGFKHIGTAKNEAGVGFVPRGELAGAIFRQGVNTSIYYKKGIVTEFIHNLKPTTLIRSENLFRDIHIQLSVEALKVHLPNLIDLSRQLGAARILVDDVFNVVFSFQDHQDMVNTAKHLDRYFKNHNLNGFRLPGFFQVYASGIHFTANPRSTFFGDKFFEAKWLGYWMESLVNVRKSKLTNPADPYRQTANQLTNRNSHYYGERVAAKWDRQLYFKSLFASSKNTGHGPSAKLRNSLGDLSALPEAVRGRILQAVAEIERVGKQNSKARPAELEFKDQSLPTKIIQEASKVMLEMDSFGVFFGKMMKEAFEIAQNEQLVSELANLQKGIFSRNLMLKVIHARSIYFGVGNSAEIRGFVSNQEFSKVLKQGLFTDYGFEYAFISHGVDTHKIQLLYVADALEQRFGPQVLKEMLDYLSANNHQWDELFDSIDRTPTNLRVPDLVTLFTSAYTGLR